MFHDTVCPSSIAVSFGPGWETTRRNGWLPLIYETMNWKGTSVANRLKVIYETQLLAYENAHFRGFAKVFS